MLTNLAFAAAALIFASTGFSQDLPKTKGGDKKKEFNPPSTDQPVIIIDSTLLRELKLKEAYLQLRRARLNGQYSHVTVNGKVVVLPPDNMACLVPDMN